MKYTTTTDITLRADNAVEAEKLLQVSGFPFLYLSPAIIRFAIDMEHSINWHKDKKDMFVNTPTRMLFRFLAEELIELDEALEIANSTSAASQRGVIEEAADVANFAMFIAIHAHLKLDELEK